MSLCALTPPTASWLKNKTARIHSPYFVNLVAEPMEPIYAGLLRLEAVKDQVPWWTGWCAVEGSGQAGKV